MLRHIPRRLLLRNKGDPRHQTKSQGVWSICFYEMAVENGFVTRAKGTIEAAGFHTLIRIF
jgi:hypothetical protein